MYVKKENRQKNENAFRGTHKITRNEKKHICNKQEPPLEVPSESTICIEYTKGQWFHSSKHDDYFGDNQVKQQNQDRTYNSNVKQNYL